MTTYVLSYLWLSPSDEVMTAAGTVTRFFRAEQPIKMGLFMIVPRKMTLLVLESIDADQSLVCRSKRCNCADSVLRADS